ANKGLRGSRRGAANSWGGVTAHGKFQRGGGLFQGAGNGRAQVPHLIGVDQLGGIGCVEGIAHWRQNLSEVLNDKSVLTQVFIGSQKALTGEAVFFGGGAACGRAGQRIGGDHVTPLFHQDLRGGA